MPMEEFIDRYGIIGNSTEAEPILNQCDATPDEWQVCKQKTKNLN